MGAITVRGRSARTKHTKTILATKQHACTLQTLKSAFTRERASAAAAYLLPPKVTVLFAPMVPVLMETFMIGFGGV
jgi:hypothetical protein